MSLTTKTRTTVYEEYCVQVIDVDSGGDTQFPLYFSLEKGLSEDMAETVCTHRARLAAKNHEFLVGNSADFEFMGKTGRTYKKTITIDDLTPREENFEEEKLTKLL